MRRRSFLKALGLAPLAILVAPNVEPRAEACVTLGVTYEGLDDPYFPTHFRKAVGKRRVLGYDDDPLCRIRVFRLSRLPGDPLVIEGASPPALDSISAWSLRGSS